MTKQQAYELAWQEFSNIERTESNLRNRAMEIYAAAFAEWTADYWVCIEKNETESIWYSNRDDINIEYTTAELITEFEKL